MMISRTMLRLASAGMALLGLTVALGAAGARASDSARSSLSYGGDAYGIGVTPPGGGGPSRLAVTGVGCDAKPGERSLSDVLSVRLPGLLVGGPATARTATSAEGDVQQTRSTSYVSHVSLLSGLIRIQSLRATSATTFTGSRYVASTSGSGVSGLYVDGRHVAWGHRTLVVPGVGELQLDQRTQSQTSTGATTSITLVTLVFSRNRYHVAPGTTLALGQATSSLALESTASGVSGYAYGVLRTGGSALSHFAPGVQVGMCDGSWGNTYSDTARLSKIPGVLTTAAIDVTVNGSSVGSPTGQSMSVVDDVDIYHGFITAKAIRARAEWTSGGLRFQGSAFSDLRMSGRRIDDPIRANTVIKRGNLRVFLKRTTSDSAGGTIVMLEVVSVGPNQYHLLPGHTLRLGSAGLSASRK